MQTPKPTYFLPALGLGSTKVIPWMLEQKASTSEFWLNLPWGWMTLCFLSFFVGQVVQDVFNSKSWIRQNWKDWTRKFEVTALNVSGQMKPRARIVVARIRFVKRINKGHLYLRAYTCTGMKRNSKVFVADLGEINNVAPDTEQQIRLATDAIAYPGWEPFNSTIGPPDADNPISLVGSSANVIEIELKTLLLKQTTRFFVKSMSYGGTDYGVGLYAQHEEEDIFEV